MKVRKRKLKHVEPTLHLIDEDTMCTPSPDEGLLFKGSDMYWYPKNQDKKLDKNDPLEELLLTEN